MSQSIDEAKQAELKQQAIEWLVRLRSDHVSDDDLNLFATWMSEDLSHSEAFLAAEKLFSEMSEVEISAAPLSIDHKVHTHQKAVSQKYKIQSNKESENRVEKANHRWLMPSLAIAVIWFFALVMYFPQQIHLLDILVSDYHTQTGEIRAVVLTDGSELLMNTNSAVSVEYDQAMRKVILHHGQVRFTVTKDSVRPFEVVIDKMKVRALGTVFQISSVYSNKINVIVQEHAVTVHLNEENRNYKANPADRVILQKGQQLHYQKGHTQLQAETVELNQVTSWQQHRLIINDQPLSDLLLELGRYRNGRIFLSDKKIASLRISGVFSLDNPDAVLNSVCKALNLEQSRLGPWWIVLHH